MVRGIEEGKIVWQRPEIIIYVCWDLKDFCEFTVESDGENHTAFDEARETYFNFYRFFFYLLYCDRRLDILESNASMSLLASGS